MLREPIRLRVRPPEHSAMRRSVHDQLDQVPAGVVEHGGRHGAHLGGRLGEGDARLYESIVLSVDVVDGKGRQRDAIVSECLTVWPDCGVSGWFEEEFDVLAGRSDGEPAVSVAYRYVGARLESEYFGVEAERLLLVIHEDTGHVKSNGQRSSCSSSHRAIASRSGVMSMEWNL